MLLLRFLLSGLHMNHLDWERDNFLDGLHLGFDNGEIRGDWDDPKRKIIIPPRGWLLEVFPELQQEAEINEKTGL